SGNNSRIFSSRGCASPLSTAPSILVFCATVDSKGGSASAFRLPGSPVLLASQTTPRATLYAASSTTALCAWSIAPKPVTWSRCACPTRFGRRAPAPLPLAASLEEPDFVKPRLSAGHPLARAWPLLFCPPPLTALVPTPRPVVPRRELGPNSYRNLRPRCLESHLKKGQQPPPDFP